MGADIKNSKPMEFSNVIYEGTADYPDLTVISGYGLNFDMDQLNALAVLNFIGKYDSDFKESLLESDYLSETPASKLQAFEVEYALEECSMKFCEYLEQVFNDYIVPDQKNVLCADDRYDTFYLLFSPKNGAVLDTEKINKIFESVFLDSGMFEGTREEFQIGLKYYYVISLGRDW